MSDFGLTPQGFKRKRYADIVESMEARAKDLFGENINLSPRSPLGLFIKVVAWFIAQTWQLAEKVYFSGFIPSADGVQLDALVVLAGLRRRSAERATGEVEFTGDEGVLVPEGFMVSTEDDVIFETTDLGELEGDPATIILPVRAVEPGSDGNVLAGTITEIVNPTAGIDEVTNPDSTTGGREREEDHELRARYKESVEKPGASTVDSIRATLLQEVEGVIDARVGENNTRETSNGAVEVVGAPTSDGDIQLTVNFEEHEIAVLGDDSQEDVAQKIIDYFLGLDGFGESEREAGTAIIKGYQDVWDLDFDAQNTGVSVNLEIIGRPSKSVECFVYGGDGQDVADKIFEVKAAGIMAYGTEKYTVEDSLSQEHIIGYTPPEVVDIYAEMDLQTDGDYPVDGDDQVIQQIIKYIGGLDADTEYHPGLGLGDDVIYTRMIAVIHEVPGITDIVLVIGVDPGNLGFDNIDINEDQVAETGPGNISIV